MLNQEQIDQFHRDGFLIVRNVIVGKELELLRNAADTVEADGINHRGEHHLYRNIDGAETYFRSEYMWDKGDIFQAITVHPELLTIAGQCIGHPFLPMNDSFVCKSPHSKVPVEWHQDPPYILPHFKETFPIPHFDVDIYIDDSTIENACVWGIPGTHLVGHIDHKRFSEKEMFENFGAKPLEMKAGDILLHTFSVLHGSAGNFSDKKRRIFYVYYGSKEAMEHCYSEWIPQKRGGYNEEGRRYIKEFIPIRKKMGLSEPLNSSLVWDDAKGFDFLGTPKTPPRYWEKLIAHIPEEKKQQIRNMQFG